MRLSKWRTMSDLKGFTIPYLLRQRLHVLGNQAVAGWMVENGEAPWISEHNQVGFARVKVDEESVRVQYLSWLVLRRYDYARGARELVNPAFLCTIGHVCPYYI